MPIRPETLARLQKLAEEVSQVVDHRVEPLQVAAVLIERDLEHFSQGELVETITTGTDRKRA